MSRILQTPFQDTVYTLLQNEMGRLLVSDDIPMMSAYFSMYPCFCAI